MKIRNRSLALILTCVLGAFFLLVIQDRAALAEEKSSLATGINKSDAPVPTPLIEGKRAFISYEIGDITSFPSTYSGGPERAYGEFYAGMRNWNRYRLVLDPKDADVVFAIRFVDSPGLSSPQIRLGIVEPKTGVSLWGFVEQVDFAIRKKSRDAAFSDAVNLLVFDVKSLVEHAAATPSAERQPAKSQVTPAR